MSSVSSSCFFLERRSGADRVELFRRCARNSSSVLWLKAESDWVLVYGEAVVVVLVVADVVANLVGVIVVER
jgi:hypothetical protein